MEKKLKEYIKKHKRAIWNFSARRQLQNKNFTIISNNCWGGQVYQDLNIPYQTPFIGLYLIIPCYLKLLQNFGYYMKQEITFAESSKYETINAERKMHRYPIGKLGDIELQMVHYKDEKEAKEKWERRKERINWNNLYVKLSERDQCTTENLREFDKLPFKNKICFTASDYEEVDARVFFSEFNGGIVENELNIYRRYFNVVDWLNKGEITRK